MLPMLLAVAGMGGEVDRGRGSAAQIRASWEWVMKRTVQHVARFRLVRTHVQVATALSVVVPPRLQARTSLVVPPQV